MFSWIFTNRERKVSFSALPSAEPSSSSSSSAPSSVGTKRKRVDSTQPQPTTAAPSEPALLKAKAKSAMAKRKRKHQVDVCGLEEALVPFFCAISSDVSAETTISSSFDYVFCLLVGCT
jgi:hypothetical protein